MKEIVKYICRILQKKPSLKTCKFCKYAKIDKKGHMRCTNDSDKMPCEDGAVMLYVNQDFACNQFEGCE